MEIVISLLHSQFENDHNLCWLFSFYLEILSRPNVLPSQVYLRDSGSFSIAKVSLGLFSSLGLFKSVSITGLLIPWNTYVVIWKTFRSTKTRVFVCCLRNRIRKWHSFTKKSILRKAFFLFIENKWLQQNARFSDSILLAWWEYFTQQRLTTLLNRKIENKKQLSCLNKE